MQAVGSFERLLICCCDLCTILLSFRVRCWNRLQNIKSEAKEVKLHRREETASTLFSIYFTIFHPCWGLIISLQDYNFELLFISSHVLAKDIGNFAWNFHDREFLSANNRFARIRWKRTNYAFWISYWKVAKSISPVNHIDRILTRESAVLAR